MTDGFGISDATVIDWACEKLKDDIELAFSDTAIAQKHLDCLRKHLPVPCRKNMPRPAQIVLHPASHRLPSIHELSHLQEEVDNCNFSILVECTQIAPLLTLWQIEDRLPSLALNIQYSYTGHDGVHETESRDNSDMPDFAIVTCAPCYFRRTFCTSYELLYPLHMEKQYVLQQTGGVEARERRQIIVFNASTALIEWHWIENEDKLPERLLSFKRFQEIPVYEFKSLFQKLTGMRRGDATILWKPPSFWLRRLPGIQQIEEPFLSPVGLYCRKKGVSKNIKSEFTHLFFSELQENLRKWKASPQEAMQYLRNQLRSAERTHSQRREFVIHYARAAGIGFEVIGAERKETVQQPSPRRTQELPFQIDENSMTVTMNGRTSSFLNLRSSLLFHLLVRIHKGRGHPIEFDSLRAKDNVWNADPVEDSSIRGALSRLRTKLRRDKLVNLANAIKSRTNGTRHSVFLDIDILRSTSK